VHGWISARSIADSILEMVMVKNKEKTPQNIQRFDPFTYSTIVTFVALLITLYDILLLLSLSA